MSMRPFKTALVLSVALALGGCAGMLAPNPVYRGDLGAGIAEGLTPQARHARAVAAFNAGQFGNAVEGFRQLLAHTPGDVAALNGLGASYDRLGRPDLAARAYRRALALRPDSVQTLNNLGYSHLMNGRPDLAYVYLAQAYAGAPGDLVVVNNYEAALGALERGPVGTQLASAAPVQPVAQVPLPRAGSYAVERLNPRVQALVATAPDPQSRRHERRPVKAGPAPRPVEIRIVSRQAAAVRPAAPDAAARLLPVVVANGTGRAGMAARISGHLQARGIRVAGLDNASAFDRQRTRVVHAAQDAASAALLAAQLPAPVALTSRGGEPGVLRLEVGADLLTFDADLLRHSARTADATNRREGAATPGDRG